MEGTIAASLLAIFTCGAVGQSRGQGVVQGRTAAAGMELAGRQVSYPLVNESFSATGSLGTERCDHTATLLTDGMVLITGGSSNAGPLATAELYDSVSGTFSATSSLAMGRERHTATLLLNGRVLIAGGYNLFLGYLSSAELYTPASGTFAATGSLASARRNYTATLLPNGKVLIAGGYSGNGVYPSSAELYDIASGTFSATGSLATARSRHTATLLGKGKVLITGGYILAPGDRDTFLTSAELYDPASGTFSPTGSLATARDLHTATLLPNGGVLIAGGLNGNLDLASAEVYDPAAGIFSPTAPLASPRAYHTATLLPNGKVLITGGDQGGIDSYDSLSSVELYDPMTGTFSPGTSLAIARSAFTATILPNGKVLTVGGNNISHTNYQHCINSSELYGSVAHRRVVSR